MRRVAAMSPSVFRKVCGHAVDQRPAADRRRRNRPPSGPRGGGRWPARGQDVQRLLDLGEALALDRVAEQDLVAEVVAGGIEFEQAARGCRSGCQFRLELRRGRAEGRRRRRSGSAPAPARRSAVAGADAQRVQLHQLARVVLVDPAGARSARCPGSAASPGGAAWRPAGRGTCPARAAGSPGPRSRRACARTLALPVRR